MSERGSFANRCSVSGSLRNRTCLDSVCKYGHIRVTMAQRDLEYVGRCQRELQTFPDEVKEQAAFALLVAQAGEKHPDAVPLRGSHGASVLEIRLPHDTNTYRVIYTTRFPGVVYALCAFQKKSTRGIAMQRQHRELIEHRLGLAASIHARRPSR